MVVVVDLSQHDDGEGDRSPSHAPGPANKLLGSRGQERLGHHAADSSDLFLISVMRARHTDHVAC